jgi:hypothetical protein
MATYKWATSETVATYLSTTLNSLATNTFVGAGAEIANQTDLYELIAIELNLASLSPTTGAYVDVWIYYAIDGTNTATAAKPLMTSNLLTTFQLDTTASTAQRLFRGGLPIWPYDFKLDVRNVAGVSFNASGNTLKYSRSNEQSV